MYVLTNMNVPKCQKPQTNIEHIPKRMPTVGLYRVMSTHRRRRIYINTNTIRIHDIQLIDEILKNETVAFQKDVKFIRKLKHQKTFKSLLP